MKKSRLWVGAKVTYKPTDIVNCESENGIVKSIPDKGAFVFVVFNCANDWNNYQNYTGRSISVQHLRPGWNYKEPEPSDTTAADDYLDYLSTNGNMEDESIIDRTPYKPNDSIIMPWGKHKGKKMEDVPDDYLYWLHGTKISNNPPLRKYLDDNIDAIIANINRHRWFNKIEK